MNKFKTLCVVFLLIIAPDFLAAQCAMCRAVLETGGGEEMAKGINNGIMYLMAVPYILIAILGFFIFKKLK